MTQNEKIKLTDHSGGTVYQITQDASGSWRLRDQQGRQIRKSQSHRTIARALQREKGAAKK